MVNFVNIMVNVWKNVKKVNIITKKLKIMKTISIIIIDVGTY